MQLSWLQHYLNFHASILCIKNLFFPPTKIAYVVWKSLKWCRNNIFSTTVFQYSKNSEEYIFSTTFPLSYFKINIWWCLASAIIRTKRSMSSKRNYMIRAYRCIDNCFFFYFMEPNDFFVSFDKNVCWEIMEIIDSSQRNFVFLHSWCSWLSKTMIELVP